MTSMLANNVVHLNVALDFNNKNVYSIFFLDKLKNFSILYQKFTKHFFLFLFQLNNGKNIPCDLIFTFEFSMLNLLHHNYFPIYTFVVRNKYNMII